MELEEGLYLFLASEPTVTALVSTRIYPVVIPQDALQPALVYQRINTTVREDTLTLEDDPIDDITVAITVWGPDYRVCKQVATAVRVALLSPARGDFGMDLQSVSWQNQVDVYDEDLRVPGVRGDYVFTFGE